MSSCHKNPLTCSMKFFQNSTLLQLTFLLAQCLLNCDPIRGPHHCQWHLVGHRLVMLDGALGALRHLMLTQLFLWLPEKGPRIPEFCLVHTACGIPLSSRSKLTKPRKETRIKQTSKKSKSVEHKPNPEILKSFDSKPCSFHSTAPTFSPSVLL